METEFRLAFFSYFFIDRNNALMMLVFFDYWQCWIYANIRDQRGFFPWAIEILNNIAKVVTERISYTVSEPRISKFSIRFIISLNVILSEKSSLTDFQYFLSSVITFGCKFEKIINSIVFWIFANGLHISCVVFCKHFENHHFYLWKNFVCNVWAAK